MKDVKDVKDAKAVKAVKAGTLSRAIDMTGWIGSRSPILCEPRTYLTYLIHIIR